MNPDKILPESSQAAQRDRDIVALLRDEQHAAAFELIVLRYQNKVYRLCVALLRDLSAAQDVAQESLIRVWKALPDYNGTAALSTWIYTITRNRCLTALANDRSVLSLSDEVIASEAETVEVEITQANTDTMSTLHRLVNELPEMARQVITLFYFEDHSVLDVAAMLGCPAGTVKTHLFRARAALLLKLSALGLASPELWIE